MNVRFVVYFPKANRLIHFEGMEICDEYDRLCFDIRAVDCTKVYKHLAGHSYIPCEKGIIKDIIIKEVTE